MSESRTIDTNAMTRAREEAAAFIAAHPSARLPAHNRTDDSRGGACTAQGAPQPVALMTRASDYGDGIQSYKPAYRCPTCFTVANTIS